MRWMWWHDDLVAFYSLVWCLTLVACGSSLCQSNSAQVIRYRSRFNPGRPNWAKITYQGKEETVFGRQPNLLCNFFHWVVNPEKKWPDHFKPCHKVCGPRWASVPKWRCAAVSPPSTVSTPRACFSGGVCTCV